MIFILSVPHGAMLDSHFFIKQHYIVLSVFFILIGGQVHICVFILISSTKTINMSKLYNNLYFPVGLLGLST